MNFGLIKSNSETTNKGNDTMNRINFSEVEDYTFYELCRREQIAKTDELIINELCEHTGRVIEAV